MKINCNGLWVTKIIYSPFFFDWIFAHNAYKRNTKPTAAPGNTIAKCRERVREIKESTTPKGVGFCGERHQDRVAFAALINPALSKVYPPRGNSLVPSPIKTKDGAAISRCMARWNDGWRGNLSHAFPCIFPSHLWDNSLW